MVRHLFYLQATRPFHPAAQMFSGKRPVFSRYLIISGFCAKVRMVAAFPYSRFLEPHFFCLSCLSVAKAVLDMVISADDQVAQATFMGNSFFG